MSNTDTPGFGKFVPGFDFLQGLAQSAAGSNATMPNFSKWVAPTLDAEELEKRIEELKIVRFWLEQNSNALGATIQALEVQKMTLATLKGMNFGFGEATGTSQPKASQPQANDNKPAGAAKQAKDAEPAAGVIDPMQMWGALTQQFQKIAQSAVNDASNVAAQTAKTAATAAQTAASAAPKRAPAKKAGAKTARPTKRK
jgi:hypothetical protein